MTIEKYIHHGVEVLVRKDLKGRHAEHCLCWYPCARFKPNETDNCSIAQALFEFDKAHQVTTPIWECAVFEETT